MDDSKQFEVYILCNKGVGGNCSRIEVMNKENDMHTFLELLRKGEGASHLQSLDLVRPLSDLLCAKNNLFLHY